MVGRRRNSSLFRAASSMSLFDRRTFLISAIASLGAVAGCGFTPAYAPGGTAAALRGHVDVDAPSDRESYALVNRLSTVFGPTTTPLYRLSYDISTTEHAIGLTRDQEITRYHIEGKVSFTLTEIQTERILTKSDVSSFTAYSATGSTVDAITAPRDAYERLMVILADQMISKLITTVEMQE